MGRAEIDYAKKLLMQGAPRKEVKRALRTKFRKNYNILTIALTRAAMELEKERGDKNATSQRKIQE